MDCVNYLMENNEEIFRLEMKTDIKVVERQAKWAGLRPGMRVADVGCGTGKTTSILRRIVGTEGAAVGIDFSSDRIDYARSHYQQAGLEFLRHDVLDSFEDIGKFDFVWVRFFLEYFRSDAFKIVQSLDSILNSGGILCLIDLDHNCLNHFGLSPKAEKAITGVMKKLQDDANFDPYAGRKLYSYLYDLKYRNIKVQLHAHHLITGPLNEIDRMNWNKKLQIACRKSGYTFDEYAGGCEEFEEELKTYLQDSRRFIYNPLICCRGRKP